MARAFAAGRSTMYEGQPCPGLFSGTAPPQPWLEQL